MKNPICLLKQIIRARVGGVGPAAGARAPSRNMHVGGVLEGVSWNLRGFAIVLLSSALAKHVRRSPTESLRRRSPKLWTGGKTHFGLSVVARAVQVNSSAAIATAPGT